MLRNLCIDDVPQLVKNLNNKNITRYLTSRVPQPYAASDAEDWVRSAQNSDLTQVIEVDGKFAGVISVSVGEFENSRSAEIGFWIAEEFWGRGIASKAISKVTNNVFASSDIVRLFAPVFSANKASMRALEKSGYQLEGIFRESAYKNGSFYDEHIFAIVRS